MSAWPDIPYERWAPTGASLHMWSQIVGKFRLALTPWVNHSWHATLYSNARGLTTSLIPGDQTSYEAAFDFIDHVLIISASDGRQACIKLEPQSVADFHAQFLAALDRLGVHVSIHGAPNEVADPVPFHQQTDKGAYDPDAAHDFWRALIAIDSVFNTFRTGFLGKVSPVHLFWGSFDLAVTRFSGRTAPRHPGGIPALPDAVTREAYSHEVSSAGFWPGGGGVDYPAFYAYAYPTPEGFKKAPVDPPEAFYFDPLGEFVLPYDAVRNSETPAQTLLRFLQTTYDAAARLGRWDRAALEGDFGKPLTPRAID
ncbi:MAG: DUF5996 family protein [Pseudomonadota bacterium]